MKKIDRSITIALLFAAALGFSSCEHNVYTETTVHEDGTLDKTITVQTADSTDNFFGLSKEKGWDLTVTAEEDSAKKDKNEKPRLFLTFRKSFASAERANEELAAKDDTLFQITSKFEKRFRWFYTYLYYSDTYHCINRIEYPIDDYVTQEDYDFIDRLPAEGKRISKADSLYLTRLHEKIFDIYGMRALFEVNWRINETLMKDANIDAQWFDTLQAHKEPIFQHLLKNDDVPYDFLFHSIDSLGIPFPLKKYRNRFDSLYRYYDRKAKFSQQASNGIYTHVINMPWQVISTNADSVSGNRLQWNPPSLKFALKDYTMYAESRKANYWAFALSAFVIVVTLSLFLRNPKK